MQSSKDVVKLLHCHFDVDMKPLKIPSIQQWKACVSDSGNIRRMNRDGSMLKVYDTEVRESTKQINELYIRLDKIEEIADPTQRERQRHQLQTRVERCEENLQYSQNARQKIMDARLQELHLAQTKVGVATL